MIWAEEQIPQDGAPGAHHHIFIQQGRLGNGVYEDLEKDRGKQQNHDYNVFIELLFNNSMNRVASQKFEYDILNVWHRHRYYLTPALIAPMNFLVNPKISLWGFIGTTFLNPFYQR